MSSKPKTNARRDGLTPDHGASVTRKPRPDSLKNQKIFAVEYVRHLEMLRNRRLRSLNRDPAFVEETAKIKKALGDLHKRWGSAVIYMLRRLPNGLIFRPHDLKRAFRGIKDSASKKAFRAYINYASRFQVSLIRARRSFQVMPIVPFQRKYHTLIRKNGQLKPLREQPVGETISEDMDEDDFDVPRELTTLLDEGKAKVIRVDDSRDSSVLNQLEALAYSPDILTFILHHTASQKYIFCLVGEKVSTEKTWRSAASVIKALQKDYYGRAKAGRPKDVVRMKKAIRLIEQRKGTLKEKAFELLPKQVVDGKIETTERYMRDLKRKLRK
jgi:hypothetical protein